MLTIIEPAVRIRRATEDDIPAVGRVFSVAAAYLIERYRPDQLGHFSFEPETRYPLYRHLLATGALFVAEEREPVGFSAAVLRDGSWFLSQLWVRPERHATGIGSGLLDQAIAWGRGASSFAVVASPLPAAQLLYLRAQMYPAWTQWDITGGDGGPVPAPEGLEPWREEAPGWIHDLDREVRGAARPEDHAWWRDQAELLHVRRAARPLGYVYVWPDGKIGPGAAHDPRDLPLLIRAARSRAPGPVTLAVPSANWAALRELVAAGFGPLGGNMFMASRPIGDASRYLSSGGALA